MSLGVLGDLNWPAVIVAGVVYYAVGALWYSGAGFGKPWMRSIGWDPGDGAPKMGVVEVVGPLLAYLVAAIAVGMLAVATGSDSFGEGLVLGLVAGVGIAGVLAYVTAVFDPKKVEPMTWFAVTAGYHLVGLVATAIIVSVWT